MRCLSAVRCLGATALLLLATNLSRAAIVINEIMYNSIEAPDVEYVELYNSGPFAVNLSSWYLLDNDLLHPRCYLAGTLNAGSYLVIPGFTSTFTAKYPGVTNLNPNQFDGATGWSLGNGGDTVRLFDPASVQIDFVNYSNIPPWPGGPGSPDGFGPSLELRNHNLDNSLASSWGASTNPPPDGTPGAVNSIGPPPPVISNVTRTVALPQATDSVTVRAQVTDDEGVTGVQLMLDQGAGYVAQSMFDDGLHNDGGAGDTLYGTTIPPHVNGFVVRYYVSATDALPQTALEPVNAPTEYYGYTVGYAPPRILINEILVRNVTGITDELGQHEDWIELRNPGPAAVDLGAFHLSDDIQLPRQWRFPSPTILAGGERLLVWCDSDPSNGPLHTSFKLDASGGYIALYDTMDHGNVAVHALTYGPTAADIAFGYLPEGSDAPEYLVGPTPGASNAASALLSPICINEFLTSSAAGGVDDWVELYNRGTLTEDIGGWYISDSEANPLRWSFPLGTMLGPGQFIVVNETALGFGFDTEGTDVILLSIFNGTDVEGQDYFDHGLQFQDVTQGRLPNGQPYWRYFENPSPSALNSCPDVPPAFGPVTGLRFVSKQEITWNPLAGANAYDVVVGSLSLLRSTAGDFTAALTGCLENNDSDTRAWHPTGPGAGRFYLVRAATAGCPVGTYDEGGQVAGRDAEIAASAAGCP